MANSLREVMRRPALVGICTTNEASGLGPVLYGLGNDGSLWCGVHTVTTEGVPSQVEWTRLSTPFDDVEPIASVSRVQLAELADQFEDENMHRAAERLRELIGGKGG